MSDKVGSVLNYSDGQIHKEGLWYLLLIFYPLLPWNELEKCKHPSEIYRLLEGSEASEGSQEKALQIFLFALKAIGGRVRGKHCANEAKKILGADLTPTPLDFSQMSSKFRFFYWLLKVARRLPDQCREHVKQHFARAYKFNYRFTKGLPQLFIRLYQDKKLNEQNIREMVSVLEEYQKGLKEDSTSHKDVNKCIGYLLKVEDEEMEPFSSGDDIDTAPSMHEAAEGREAVKKKVYRPKRKSSNSKSGSSAHRAASKPGDTDSPAPNSTDTSMDGATTDQTPTSSLNSLHGRVSMEIDNTNTLGNSAKYCGRKWHSKKCVVYTIALLVIPTLLSLVGVVALSVCSVYVWSPLSQLPSAHDVQHREGNIPILAEVNSFLTKQVTIQQEIDFDDALHKVYIFLSDFACSELPTLTVIQYYNETSVKNIDPVYMLEHSEIEVSICASTQNLHHNPLIFYILRPVEEYLAFEPHHLGNKVFRKIIPVGRNNESKCTPVVRNIRERDYYSMKFIVRDDVTFTYNLTMTIKQVDIEAINNATIVGILYPDNDEDQETSKTISFGTENLCLFADIKESIPSINNYTTLETHLKPRYGAALGITVSMTVLLFLLALSVELLICFIKRRMNLKSRICRGYENVEED